MVNPAFAETFSALRAILQRHGKKLAVVRDVPGDFQLASPSLVDRTGKPLFVAAVQIRKNYVSYHLMPVYACPALLKTLSPELKGRMQGKACFNFTTIEPTHAKELSALTRTSFERFKTVKLPWMQTSKRSTT